MPTPRKTPAEATPELRVTGPTDADRMKVAVATAERAATQRDRLADLVKRALAAATGRPIADPDAYGFAMGAHASFDRMTFEERREVEVQALRDQVADLTRRLAATSALLEYGTTIQ
jgi:hypothetical protein